MRAGIVVDALEKADATESLLARLMIGQDVEPEHRPARSDWMAQSPVLELREIQLQPKHAPAILDHVSFTVHAGEIFGVAGVSGNGQDELCDLIAGSRTASAGQILLDGTDITNASIPRSDRGGAWIRSGRSLPRRYGHGHDAGGEYVPEKQLFGSLGRARRHQPEGAGGIYRRADPRAPR